MLSPAGSSKPLNKLSGFRSGVYAVVIMAYEFA